MFCTSPLPCSGGHGPPSGPWPWAVINAASQYGTLRNNSYAGGSTYSKSFTYLPQKNVLSARGGEITQHFTKLVFGIRIGRLKFEDHTRSCESAISRTNVGHSTENITWFFIIPINRS